MSDEHDALRCGIIQWAQNVRVLVDPRPPVWGQNVRVPPRRRPDTAQEETPCVNVVRVPRPQLVRVANLIDEAAKLYVGACSRIQPDGYWEAPLEAFAQSWLCVRNVEAVAILAKSDEVLVPAAWANARNAFEIAIRIIWLLYPGDRFECEMRWLGLLAEWERFHGRMTIPFTSDDAEHRARAEKIRMFRKEVENRVPSGYTPVTRVPSVEAILEETKTPEMKAVYIQGSQFLHGTMAATSLYRHPKGKREYGEFTTVANWILPLRTSWLSLKEMARFVTDRLSGGPGEIDWKSFVPTIDGAFQDLGSAMVDELA